MKREPAVKNSRVALLVLLCVLLIAGAGILSADEAKPDVTPVISRPGALVFKDDFGKEKIGPEWKPLHGTCWKIVEGTLKGEPSTKEYQQPQKLKPPQNCRAAARQPMGDRDQRNYLGVRVIIRKASTATPRKK
jgi:hypothetical protein